jgi:hypothetical protein
VSGAAKRSKLTIVDLTTHAGAGKTYLFYPLFPSVISAFDIQLFRKNGICKKYSGRTGHKPKDVRPFLFYLTTQTYSEKALRRAYSSPVARFLREEKL